MGLTSILSIVALVLTAQASAAPDRPRFLRSRVFDCGLRIAYNSRSFETSHELPLRRQKPGSTYYLERSAHPAAPQRPILVLIPGGPGLSHVTLSQLGEMKQDFDLIFVDPPGAGPEAPLHVYDGVQDNRFEHYDEFIDQFSAELAEISAYLNHRPLVLLGHSYGGVFAAEVAARNGIKQTINLAGMVALSSYLSHDAYKVTEQIRREKRGGSIPFNSAMNAVMDFDGVTYPDLDLMVRWHQGLQKDRSVLEEDLQIFAKEADRQNLIDWAVAYGDLIWNKTDERIVRSLLNADRETCSPEVVRYLLKPWRVDAKAGDFILSRLAQMPHIKKIIIAGGDDHLLPPEVQERDAKRMGAQFHLLPGASHFVFTSDGGAVREILVKSFGPVEAKP